LADAARQLYNLRFTFATQQVGDVKEIRNLRKEIARMRGILRERELAGEDLSASLAQPAGEEPDEDAPRAELAQTGHQGAT
jgi:large subunit ribosomal protein L29